MVLVRLAVTELSPMLIDGVSVCAHNAPGSVVIGGAEEAVRQQVAIFDLNKIEYKKLRVSHAYHTPMMTGMLKEYEQILGEVSFNDFDTKVFSTYTGALVSPDLFCTPQYWLDQIMNGVNFVNAIEDTSNYLSNPIFIELGPGNGLSSFIKAIFDQPVNTVNVLPRASGNNNALHSFYKAKALLYAKGLAFDLPEEHAGKRIALPTYVFAKKYFWKPNVSINYGNFQEIKASYHHNNEKYIGDRLRSAVEIQLSDKGKVSDEVLNKLNDLHVQYLRDIENLLAAEGEKVNNKIEVLYDDLSFQKGEDSTTTTKAFNKKRSTSNIFVAPNTAIEKGIAQHWGKVLGYEPVGVLDNYFELGGNSLLATRLMTQLSDEFNISLSFKELSECLTIKELAVLVESKIKIQELVEEVEFEDTNDENFIEL